MIAKRKRLQIGKEMLQFNLPYPPTINNYYLYTKAGIKLKPHGKAYRQTIYYTLYQCIGKEGKWDGEAMHGDLMVEIIIYPPDKRKRDIDNIKKALFDALQYAGLYENDYQICDDHTIRIDKIVPGGLIDFKIMKAPARDYISDTDYRISKFFQGFSL